MAATGGASITAVGTINILSALPTFGSTKGGQCHGAAFEAYKDAIVACLLTTREGDEPYSEVRQFGTATRKPEVLAVGIAHPSLVLIIRIAATKMNSGCKARSCLRS